jgi:hypothetical protein
MSDMRLACRSVDQQSLEYLGGNGDKLKHIGH